MRNDGPGLEWFLGRGYFVYYEKYMDYNEKLGKARIQ